MRNLLLGTIIPFLGSAQLDGGKCSYAVELVQVQDGSGSFGKSIDAMKQQITSIISELKETYQEFKYGLSGFVDKPIPSRGLGPYGGYNGFNDYCYLSKSALSNDSTVIQNALGDLRNSLGYGGVIDLTEASIDGMMYAVADKKMGWSTEEYSPNGRPNVRIAVVITDAPSHLNPNATQGTTDSWNYPLTRQSNGEITGGFGCMWYATYGRQIQDWAMDNYTRVCDLFSLQVDGQDLTEDQKQEFDELVALTGPWPWPDMLPNPGDGSDPDTNCALVEYASLEQAGALLKEYNVLPIFLVYNPIPDSDLTKMCNRLGMTSNIDYHQCLVEVYKSYITTMGVPGVVATASDTDVADQIVAAVKQMTDMICKQSTSTSSTSTPSTPTTAGIQEPTTTAAAVIPPVTKPGSLIPIWPVVTVVPPNGGEVTTVASSNGDNTPVADTTTTTAAAVIAVVPPTGPAGGASVGTIAGATAGAVAGAAAIGGLLYSKFGAGLFGHSAPAELDAVQQVDVPENPVERETMEEVTMDMFQ